MVIHKNTIGKDYTEKILTGPIIQQIRDVLQYFKTNIVEELVTKSAKQAESIRFFNYPFQAIEEAVVNAVYHKSYERENSVEIQIHKDKIEILNFPGPMPPIDQAMLKKQRVVARDYRNRKIGGFLKELKLTEGRGTGLPIIHNSLEENGSPPPVFETDENNAYFLCILPVHPLTNSILGSQDDSRRDEDKGVNFSELSDITPYLSLSVSELGDRDKEAIRERINDTIKKVLNYCQAPKSRDEIFDEIGLYKNTKNFQNHIKPLIETGWLHFTLPDKLTSRDQKYYTTDLGKKLLDIISIDSNSGIKRIPVASSNIASVGYDKEAHILEIEFHHGAIYQYIDVPEKVYEELMNSPSQVAYFMNEIKEKYSYNKNKQ